MMAAYNPLQPLHITTYGSILPQIEHGGRRAIMNNWNPRGSLASTAAPPLPGQAFVFTGTASEYARIWIVNLLLTVLTLGIYSAWAKVRRLRWFYGNTRLDGHGFDYHADPVRILIGRLIVVCTLLAINILSHLSPWFFLLLLPYFVALPWVINRSMAFNAQMTSYRNIRFSFHGDYWRALGVFVLMPIAAALSAGLLAPVASRLRSNYVGSRLRFGTAWFETRTRLGPLYANLAVAGLVLLLGAALIFGALMLVFALEPEAPSAKQDYYATTAPLSPGLMALPIAIYASFFVVFYVYRAGVRNVAFSATTLDGGHRLSSRLSRGRYLGIMLSNAVMVVCSLGLLWPVAAVRSWRYLAESTRLHPNGPLDGFLDQESRNTDAASAEYLDLGGFDFGV